MNSSPIANDDTVLTDEFSVTVDVLANDYDLDDDELTITDAVVSSGMGDVEFTNTDITFTPNGSSEAMITYTITDSFGHYANAVLTVTVSPTGGGNTPPIANNDIAFTTVDQPVTVDVLANDFDADGDTFIIDTIQMDTKLGTVDVNEDNTLTFTPTVDFVGDAAITYRITDTSAASATASLIVAVGGAIDGDEFNNTLTGSSTDDTLNGMEGNDKLLGNNGDDWLDGGDGNDSLIGGNGDDQLEGGDGSDQYIFGLGDGQDTIDNVDYDDAVDFDRLLLGVGINSSMIELQGDPDNTNNLVIAIKGTSDRVTIQDHFFDESYQLDEIKFADGTVWSKAQLSHIPVIMRGEEDSDDMLFGSERNEIIEGLSGDDELYGIEGNDTLVGGLGDDSLEGGSGDDTYIFNLNDGQDTLNSFDESEFDEGVNNVDTLIFGNGIDTSMIELQADSDNIDNLVVAIKGTADRVILQDYFVVEAYQLDQITFANGTVWSKANIAAMTVINTGDDDDNELIGSTRHDVISGLAGDDTLVGNDGNDTLVGGIGDDSLEGGSGNDTYMFNLNDGQDTLNNFDENEYYEGINSVDTLVFGLGIDASMIQLQGDSDYTDNLVLVIKGTSDRVILQDYFADESYQLDEIKFADGTVWDREQLNHIQLTIRGEDNSDDVLFGTERDEVMDGLSGDDDLDGDDGNDTLVGGLGDDVLAGGSGNDSYLFNVGDGQDNIYNFDYNEYVNGINSIDTLVFGVGIDASMIELQGDPDSTDNLVLAIKGTSDRVILQDYFADESYQLDEIKFADGTVLTQDDLAIRAVISIGGAEDDDLEGNDYNDIIIGYEGDDFLQGMAGSDLLMGNKGDDFLDGGADNDYLDGGEGADFLDGGEGNDELHGRNGDDFLDGGDGNDSLYGDIGDVANIGNDTLFGGDGNDSVFAGEGDDILIGGKGDDYLRGEGGNDTYVFNRGDGQDIIVNYDISKDSRIIETLVFGEGISSVDIVFSKDKINTNDLIISIKGTNDRITINSYFRDAHQLGLIAFADGTLWNETQITQLAYHKKIEGTVGSDTLQGGSGDDTYIVNDVHDMVVENTNAGIDTVESTLSYTLRDNLENLTLIGNDDLSGTGNAANNLIIGNTGGNRLLAGGGDDTLNGGAGGDTLNGGEGADNMFGGTGNDTFTVENVADSVIESADEGFDTVNSFISYTLTANVERLILEGFDNLDGTGNELDNTLNGNNANNHLIGGLGNDTLQGKGGADTLEGGLGNDIYYVDNVGDVVTELANEGTDKVSSSISYTLTEHVEQLFLAGMAGVAATGNVTNNIIYGNDGNNQLFGGAGNDSLNGGAGNDMLAGDAGNDTLVGGLGNDSYVFGIGLGQDTINNTDAANGNDTVFFDAGISADQLWLRQLGNDLEVSIMGTTNIINVQNWYSDTAKRVDGFALADGKTLFANEVQTLVEAMAAFAAPALGQTSLTTAQHTVLDSVIAASW